MPVVPTLPGRGGPVMLPTPDGDLAPALELGRTDVKIYVCGITPYDATHLGHAATYLLFDQLIRALADSGVSVSFVENVTDVDDPLFERARQSGRDWQAIAAEQTNLFIGDMTSLGVIPPDSFVFTSDRIQETANLVKRLIDLGLTYEIAQNIYLDLGSYERLPATARASDEGLLALFAERGGDPSTPGKRNPLDPILWINTEIQPNWVTAVGQGRPGWHVECVSIVESYLGLPIDIQGGGKDLEFPHHQMCSSTVEKLTGGSLARHYVHSGLVFLDGAKMSKSLGNLVFVSKLISQGVNPMCIRLALLDRDWQADLDWKPDLLARADQRLTAWTSCLDILPAATDDRAISPFISRQGQEYLSRIRGHLAGGLDVVAALSEVDIWAYRLINIKSHRDEVLLFSDTVKSLFGVTLT